jgi:hypothetical protein
VFFIEGQTARKGVYAVKGERGGNLFLDPSLRSGAHVVTEGRALLKDGDRVDARLDRIVEETGASAAFTAEVKQ